MSKLNYNNHIEKINKLKVKLYKKYNRKHLAFILNVSEIHVSRLLNNKSKMSIKQYFVLRNLLDEKIEL